MKVKMQIVAEQVSVLDIVGIVPRQLHRKIIQQIKTKEQSCELNKIRAQQTKVIYINYIDIWRQIVAAIAKVHRANKTLKH